MGELSSEFKTAFGSLLVLITLTDSSVDGYIKYSEKLLTFTKAGLMTIGKYENNGNREVIEKGYARLRDAITKTKSASTGRFAWEISEIRQAMTDIDSEVLPVALSNGILVLNQEVVNIQNLFDRTKGLRETEE